MITLDKASARIGAIDVIREISLTVSAGELVAVIGANGAGKTSLLRAISGLLPLTGGDIQYAGQTVRGTPAHDLARRGLVHVPQGRQIVPALSVLDNLCIGAVQAGVGRAEIEARLQREFERFPVLRERQHISGASLSGGEQQMLAVARGLMMGPQVLLLDEPSLGLAPQIVQIILRTLRELADQGLAVLLVEQAAFLALGVADRGVVLRNGAAILEGDAARLRADRSLVEGYLS
jgi:branched-chain amino acid transport system ATP-binding protein